MRIRNMRHGVNTTCGLIAALMTLLPGAMVHPITAEPGAMTPRQAAPAEPLPEAGDVVTAYMRIRSWVDSFDPPPVDGDASRLPIAGAEGVCVMLRKSGRVIGTGVAVRARGSSPDRMTRRAVGRALAEVLADRAVSSLPEVLHPDVGRGLMLEFEVAGALEPLPGRSFAQIAEQVRPGLEGVALRRGDRWTMLFPSQLRATGGVDQLAGRMAGAVNNELGLPAADFNTLVNQHGLAAYRFRTMHLAQPEPRARPFETMRGDRVVPLTAVTRDGLANFADRLAAYLVHLNWQNVPPPSGEGVTEVEARKALGLRGTYHPLPDTYRPIVAPPLEQALGAFALAYYATTLDRAPDDRAGALHSARAIIEDLANVESVEDDPRDDPVACAGIVYAISVLPDSHTSPIVHALFDEAAQVVTRSFDPDRGFVYEDPETNVRRAPGPHGQSMIAGALARLARLPGGDVELDHVRRAIDVAWDAMPAHQQVSLLPWIGWAELDYVEATGGTVARAERLRELVVVLDRSRITQQTESGGGLWLPDLAGGFVLDDRATASRWPTAQSVRPASFLGTVLCEPDLLPAGERPEAVVGQLATMRFLMQLSVRDEFAWSVRNPGRCRGGLRASLWDGEIAVPAQALGLIAVVETLRGLDAQASEAD